MNREQLKEKISNLPDEVQIDDEDEFWDTVFMSINSSDVVYPKVWGAEAIIINCKDFGFKYLIFWKGGKFSLHKHDKREIFLVIKGRLGVTLLKDGVTKKFLIDEGAKIYIDSETYHSLEAFENSIVIEVSTEDFADGSVRLNSSSYNPNNNDNISEYSPPDNK